MRQKNEEHQAITHPGFTRGFRTVILSKTSQSRHHYRHTGTAQPELSGFFTGLLTPQGFNTAGFAIADLHYAGNGQNTLTPANSNAVAQYDVACFQAFLH